MGFYPISHQNPTKIRRAIKFIPYPTISHGMRYDNNHPEYKVSPVVRAALIDGSARLFEPGICATRGVGCT